MENKDFYSSIRENDMEALFKEKGSKFISYAFPVRNEEEVKAALVIVKKKHHAARHWCYAYRLGEEGKDYRVNDDGEPSNSAGQPIYGQILAYGLTDVLVVVVRYFGGVKLGVGGLIQAYKTSSQEILEVVETIDFPILKKFRVKCNYDQMNKVMRLIKDFDLKVLSQELALDCKFELGVLQSQFEKVYEIFSLNHHLELKISS
ncbi:MAG: IMPACT family protein [Flavobacteriaceae bacterium]